MAKIKAGSLVVIYRPPLSAFFEKMQDRARSLKGKMDTVTAIRGSDVYLRSGWVVSKSYLKVIVS